MSKRFPQTLSSFFKSSLIHLWKVPDHTPVHVQEINLTKLRDSDKNNDGTLFEQVLTNQVKGKGLKEW